MIDYVVAIPTYKRYDEVTKKAFTNCKRRCFQSKIHVFVANKVEEKLYREKMDPDTYGILLLVKKV